MGRTRGPHRPSQSPNPPHSFIDHRSSTIRRAKPPGELGERLRSSLKKWARMVSRRDQFPREPRPFRTQPGLAARIFTILNLEGRTRGASIVRSPRRSWPGSTRRPPSAASTGPSRSSARSRGNFPKSNSSHNLCPIRLTNWVRDCPSHPRRKSKRRMSIQSSRKSPSRPSSSPSRGVRGDQPAASGRIGGGFPARTPPAGPADGPSGTRGRREGTQGIGPGFAVRLEGGDPNLHENFIILEASSGPIL
jgi:hypothetical protein